MTERLTRAQAFFDFVLLDRAKVQIGATAREVGFRLLLGVPTGVLTIAKIHHVSRVKHFDRYYARMVDSMQEALGEIAVASSQEHG